MAIKESLLKRAVDVVNYFSSKRKDPKMCAMTHYPEHYRKMLRVFRDGCYTFNEDDVSRWESLIMILRRQDRYGTTEKKSEKGLYGSIGEVPKKG